MRWVRRARALAGSTRQDTVWAGGRGPSRKCSSWSRPRSTTWSSSLSRCSFFSWKACSSAKAACSCAFTAFSFLRSPSRSLRAASNPCRPSPRASSRSILLFRWEQASWKRAGSQPARHTESSRPPSKSLSSSDELWGGRSTVPPLAWLWGRGSPEVVAV